MTRTQKIFLGVILLAVLACWSPSKLLPYGVPLVSVGLMLFAFREEIWGRWFVLTLVLAAWFLLDMLLYPDFIVQNGFLAILTYSSFFLPFLIPSRYLASREIYLKISYLVIATILFEGAIGLVQIGHQYSVRHSFDLGAGDVVEGTIDLAFPSAPGFETPSYAAMMAFSTLFLIPLYFQTGGMLKRIAALTLLMGGLTFLLASVVHSLLFLLVAVLISGLVTFASLRRVRLRPLVLAVGGTGLMLLVAYFLLPKNIGEQVPSFFRQFGSNPKVILAERLAHSVDEYPALLFTGLGPGQGVGRAALIATGHYLSSSIERFGIRPQYTDLMSSQMMDLWRRYGRRSSALRPLSAWLGLFGDAGALGFLGFVFILLYLFLRRPNLRTGERTTTIHMFAFRAGLLYLFLLGFQEYYWEYPQAIFLGILLLMVLYAQATASSPVRSGAPEPPAS